MMNLAASRLAYLATLAAHAVLWTSPVDGFERVDAIEATHTMIDGPCGFTYRAFEVATVEALETVDDMSRFM